MLWDFSLLKLCCKPGNSAVLFNSWLDVECALASYNSEYHVFICYFIIERKLQIAIYHPPPHCGVHVQNKDKSHVFFVEGCGGRGWFQLEIMTALETSNEETVATRGQREVNSWSRGIWLNL